MLRAETPRGNYVLYCAGCNGLEGVFKSRLVPDLRDRAAYLLNLPDGRRYLVRPPNVAFSTTSDEVLAGLLNYVAFDLGGAGAPRRAALYTRAEVSQLRPQPLTETSLVQLRQRMVGVLIEQYNATAGLRLHGDDDYQRFPQPQDR